MNNIIITGEDLTIKKVIEYSKNFYEVSITNKVIEKISKAREFLEEEIKKGRKVYGVNTGLGALLKEEKELSENVEEKIIKEHALNTGEYVEKEIARATLLILLNQLSTGRSTISLDTFNYLLKISNLKFYPLFKADGSLGASGDLIPLANLILCLLGEGYVEVNNKIIPSKELFKDRLKLKFGEAISLINSTAFSCASLAFSIYELKKLLDLSCGVAALVCEALRANVSHFKNETLYVKKHVDQMIIGNFILSLLEDSKLINFSGFQEAYSIRCIPQVYGAIKSFIDFCEYNTMREMNSYSGNPVIIYETKEILTGGNFHAQYLSLSSDILKICIANLAFMIERRINRLLNPNLNKGLPPFLIKEKDSSGLMICQYLAAYYANECRVLATPSSSISISTSADQEDFVSMSGNSVNELRKSLKCLKYLISLEALCSYEAVRFFEVRNLGKGTKYLFYLIDEKVNAKEDIKDKIEIIYNNLIFYANKLNEQFGSLFTE